ncbi:PIN domain-containing protein [Candidatus Woesearchaeota archaeon]|nr:PIN domain-containing protein [Candidatus Woesearchaeota archaeon]
MILDSDFIINLLKNEPDAVRKAEELNQSSEKIKTTVINAFEVLQGNFNNNEKDKGIIRKFFTTIKILEFDYEDANTAAEIHHDLQKTGLMINPEDSMIAGIAIQYNEKILTKKIRHFNRIKNLIVETY